MFREFREFISRGNVIDLAVGIIIGAAFTAIVNSLVKDILMPPLGYVTGGLDFSNHFLNLSGVEYASLAEAQAAGAPTVNYGLFLNAVISFLIVAAAIFLVVKQVNRLRRQQDDPEVPPAAPTQKDCPFCLSTVPLKATRCAYCTSDLREPAA